MYLIKFHSKFTKGTFITGVSCMWLCCIMNSKKLTHVSFLKNIRILSAMVKSGLISLLTYMTLRWNFNLVCTKSSSNIVDSWLNFQNGRTCLGDFIYHYITSEKFSPECLLDCLDLSSEHVALEIANCVEASIYVWRRRAHSKPPANPNRSSTKSSWEIVKDFMADGDKRELLAERAENVLLSLKQRFPGLTQTTLDTSKIQCNKVPCFCFHIFIQFAIFSLKAFLSH